MKRSIVIMCAVILLGLGIANADEQVAGFSWNEVNPVKVSATFNHLDTLNNDYVSDWTGTIDVQLEENQDGSMKMKFLVGLGKYPSRLNVNWNYMEYSDINGIRKISTGPIPISLASSQSVEADLVNWAGVKSKNNPSLEILLDKTPDIPNSYSNSEDIHVQLFTWIYSGEEKSCLYLGDLEIQSGGLMLNMVQGSQISMNIMNAELKNISQLAWDAIIQKGNEHVNLPEELTGAVSYMFNLENEELDETNDSESVDGLKRSILGLFTTGTINTGKVRRLVRKLDRKEELSINGKYSTSVKKLMDIETQIASLSQNGNIIPLDGTLLLAQVRRMISRMSNMACLSEMPDIPFEPLTPEVTWIVRQTLGGYVPNGSDDYPFWSIAQALDEAEAQHSAGVELIVDGGVYDSFTITRDTTLTATAGTRPVIIGTIYCDRPAYFGMSNFHLVGAPSPGAIYVDNSGARISLSNVMIQDATRFGIYQSGGELNLHDVYIAHTYTEPVDEIIYGSGLVITNGVSATLREFSSVNNESAGVVVSGVDTLVFGNDILVRGNHYNENFLDNLIYEPERYSYTLETYSGGFEVGNEAEVTLHDVVIRNNELMGLYVHDHAHVSLTDASIGNTHSVTAAGDEVFGGGGIQAVYAGYVEVTNFVISHCPLVGVGVHPEDSAMDLHIGEVRDNVIGAANQVATFDVGRLTDRVAYIDNVRDLDSETLPIPDSGLPDAW